MAESLPLLRQPPAISRRSLSESLPQLGPPVSFSTGRRDLREAVQKRLEVAAVCVAYGVFGPSVIIVNNHIVNDLDFPYPLILSALGLMTTSCFCAVMMRCFPSLATRASAVAPSPTRASRSGLGDQADQDSLPAAQDSLPAAAPGEPWRPTFSFWLYKMAPIGVTQGLTFACGNAAYMYLTITFTQMLSAFTPTVRTNAHHTTSMAWRPLYRSKYLYRACCCQG